MSEKNVLSKALFQTAMILMYNLLFKFDLVGKYLSHALALGMWAARHSES
jgi:hypothetical protein